MAAAAALNARKAASATLNSAIDQLTRYKDKPNLSARLLQQKLDYVLEAKEDLTAKHYLYADKANRDLEEDELVTWLKERVDRAIDATDEVFLIIEGMEDAIKADKDKTETLDQKAKEKRVAELQYQADEKHLRERIGELTKVIESEDPTKEDVVDAKAGLEGVELALQDQIESWNDYKATLREEAELKLIFDIEEEVKKFVATSRVKTLTFISKLEPPHPGVGKVSTSPSASSNEASRNSFVKTEKLATPTFNGNIRTFAQFKGDFTAVIAPHYPDKVHQVHLLKYTALKGPAKALVENLSDLNEIWKRLESRYGDTLEIVNLVVSDIENLQFNKKEFDKGMINLVDTLEKGVRDLEAVKSKHEIANAYTVKLLEAKLPSVIYTKWLEKEEEALIESVDSPSDEAQVEKSKSRFERLLNFLKTERKHAERRLMLKKGDAEEKGDNKNRNSKFSGSTRVEDSRKRHGKCLIHPQANHFTRKCKVFLGKNVEERGQIVVENQACKLCLSTSHIGQDCPFLSKWEPCKVSGCSQYHSSLLHGCSIQYCYTQLTQLTMMNKTILLIQRVKVTMGYINSLWDNGSTISLITKECAKQHKLHGIPVEYDLVTVGNNVVPQETLVYQFAILDTRNKPHMITAFEIENICGSIQSVNTSKFTHLFKDTTAKSISRPHGSIDLLIGMDNADIHPKEIESQEGLVLYNSMFGSGKVIGGRHKSAVNNETLNLSALCARTGISNVRIKRFVDPGVDFFSAEDFGVKIPPRCNKCKGCKDCRFETQQLSRIEQGELTVIRNNLQLDPVTKVWKTPYPYKVDPEILKNNKTQAHALMLKTEKRLSRDLSSSEAYNKQFDDLLDRGVIVEISKEEQEQYKGPVNYVSHHEVFKPDSSSTPIRLVVNSSLKYNNISLNDILMKGPNSIRSLFGIQLQFRTFLVALVGDIHKFYHSIYTTEREKHLRRLLWRHMETDQEPKTYGILRLMFGDKPAAAISSIAIQETAEAFKHVNEVAADNIRNNTYVDDITSGADTTEEAILLKAHMEDILSRGGFKMKGWVMSGDTCKESLSLLGSGKIGRVLGLLWNPLLDLFFVHVRINLSRKVKGAHIEEDLTYEQIPRILELVITLRIVLGIVHSCYDPYGLVAALTIKLKIELRKLFGCEVKIGWDDPLSTEIKGRWVRILQDVKEAEKISFKRCIKPKVPVSGKPTLIVCNDGSNEAMCVTAHVRWPHADGTYSCNLFAAKTRVTPLKKESIPRIELQSAVMAVRLSKEIREQSGLEFEEVIHILDSKCTLAILHKGCGTLREYMANRASEVLDSTTVEIWNWSQSKENVSDLGTRSNATVEDINETSDWQLGRPWMRLPKHDWRISQDYTGALIPEEEVAKPLLVAHVGTSNKFDIERFKGRSYILLLRVVALVQKIFHIKSLTRIPPLIAAEIQLAEKFCIQLSMAYTIVDFDKGKFRSLGACVDEEGIIIVNSRALTEMKQHYGADRFPILTYNDPLSFIWMQHVHREDHTGITRTVAKSRRKFWIVKAQRLAEKVKNSCYRCRVTDKILAEQKMAPLPKSRTKIAPAFYQISMDLTGPVIIRDTVKKRSHMKVWIVIFNCTVSRAMYLDLTEDYSTDAILQTIRRFVSIRGCPSEIYSDQGSQLVKASKETAALVKDWDWSVVHNWSASQGIKWSLAPAEGQHTNGLSESLIGSVKRSLKNKVTGNNILTFSQLQMVLFEVANIINSRPIGIVTGSDPEQPCPITPNDLILGRATSAVPQGPFDSQQSRNVTKQFQFLQSLVSSWWNTWYQTVFPSLVPSYKWLQRHRNICVGDMCLIRYRNDVRATYRLGVVVRIKKGDDGLVRTIELKYKLPNEKVFRTVDRPVQGVSVIVPVEEQEKTLNPAADVFTPRK